jgi:hypothetical protein
MRSFASLALAVVAFASAPAQAGDLILTKAEATPLSEHAIGTPYWILQAQCAGLYGATANFHTAKGRSREADSDTRMGVSFMDDAIERLRRDRNLDFEAALSLAGTQVDAARAHSKSQLDRGDRSHWNAERSFCLDVYDAYHHSRRQRD